MERIRCTTVTDTLMKALEHAEGMDGVLVLYYAKDGQKGCSLGSDDMNAAQCLWLIEQFKAWLMGLEHRPGWNAEGD